MTSQIERSLQQEIAWRLKAYPVVAAAIPNGLWIPARTEAERILVARIISRMKTDGMLTPGAGDLVLAGAKGCAFVECKRPRTRDLLTVRPKGRLSPDQRDFRDLCAAAGVTYLVAHAWSDIEPALGGLY